MLDVYIPYEPRQLAHLQAQLVDSVCLHIATLPETYHMLVNGRPTREQLQHSQALHTLIIPFAGVPATTRQLMQDFPQIAVHNLHHNAIPTAEMALALLLSVARRLIPVDRAFRQHDWTPRYAPSPATLLYGKRALIVGYGAIGEHLGVVLRAMGVQVRGTRRRHTDTANGIYPADQLHTLLPETDILLVCVPGTPDTEGMIGAQELALLPKGAMLVNVGRGAVVDQYALYEALKNGHLHGAGQDVWYHYPPDEASRSHTPPADVPFHELDNMVMSPHRAGGGGVADMDRMRAAALAELFNMAARGETLPHRVTLDLGY